MMALLKYCLRFYITLLTFVQFIEVNGKGVTISKLECFNLEINMVNGEFNFDKVPEIVTLKLTCSPDEFVRLKSASYIIPSTKADYCKTDGCRASTLCSCCNVPTHGALCHYKYNALLNSWNNICSDDKNRGSCSVNFKIKMMNLTICPSLNFACRENNCYSRWVNITYICTAKPFFEETTANLLMSTIGYTEEMQKSTTESISTTDQMLKSDTTYNIKTVYVPDAKEQSDDIVSFNKTTLIYIGIALCGIVVIATIIIVIFIFVKKRLTSKKKKPVTNSKKQSHKTIATKECEYDQIQDEIYNEIRNSDYYETTLAMGKPDTSLTYSKLGTKDKAITIDDTYLTTGAEIKSKTEVDSDVTTVANSEVEYDNNFHNSQNKYVPPPLNIPKDIKENVGNDDYMVPISSTVKNIVTEKEIKSENDKSNTDHDYLNLEPDSSAVTQTIHIGNITDEYLTQADAVQKS